MVNRKIFFDIFFYNKETPSRELMEMAENLWRNYMTKYGLGLDAGAAVEPTYDEVREITIMANYAVEMVAKQIAEAEEEEKRRKQAARDAWERSWEESVVAAVDKPTKEPAEENAEEAAEETTAEAAEPVTEEAQEEAAVAVPEEAAAEADEEVIEEITEEPAPIVPPEAKAAPVVQTSEIQPRLAGPACDISLWVEQLTHWCGTKGMQCIQSIDDGDVYLHVYLPHKKKVHTVGNWCFRKDTSGADLAAEITKLYAYCTGFADCFEQLNK